MAKIKIADLVIDFSGARAFVRKVRSGSSATTRGHRKAAERYLRWLQKRYQKYSMGGGDWPDLAESTVRRKKQNKDVILVEYMNLYNSLAVRRSGKSQYTVGIFSQQTARRSSKTLQQIATIHQRGEGRVPQRRIVVMPSTGVNRSMRQDIQKGVNEDVRSANRASR